MNSTDKHAVEPDHKGRTARGSVMALLGIVVSVAYLLNFTLGLFPELPDNLPIIGNLDEALAAGLLLTSLRYFGIDPLPFLNRLTRVKRGPSS